MSKKLTWDDLTCWGERELIEKVLEQQEEIDKLKTKK
jgi:hypothetical protein